MVARTRLPAPRPAGVIKRTDAACPPGQPSRAGPQRSPTYETVTLTPAWRSQFPVVAVACTTALAFGA
jgi:hypothetical protein